MSIHKDNTNLKIIFIILLVSLLYIFTRAISVKQNTKQHVDKQLIIVDKQLIIVDTLNFKDGTYYYLVKPN